jgi:hypothetical protein
MFDEHRYGTNNASLVKSPEFVNDQGVGSGLRHLIRLFVFS